MLQKPIKTSYKRQWVCDSPHCKAEYQRKKGLGISLNTKSVVDIITIGGR